MFWKFIGICGSNGEIYSLAMHLATTTRLAADGFSRFTMIFGMEDLEHVEAAPSVESMKLRRR